LGAASAFAQRGEDGINGTSHTVSLTSNNNSISAAVTPDLNSFPDLTGGTGWPGGVNTGGGNGGGGGTATAIAATTGDGPSASDNAYAYGGNGGGVEGRVYSSSTIVSRTTSSMVVMPS
jgi:hypothetical protein